MSRTRGCVLALLALLSPVVAPVSAGAAERPVSAILVDASDGSVLYARGAELVRRPASLTKMMTLFLVFDAMDAKRLTLKDRIPISRAAANQRPSRLGVKPGTTLGLDEAIRAIAVGSSNDVAVAVAEKLAGSEARFAQQMTAKARALGLRETAFGNVTGLPGANVTTAHDMAMLSIALLREHPLGYGYFSARSFSWGPRRIRNHNHLLGRVDGLDGIKTGYTVEAGYNLAASAKRRGRRLIAVVLGERSVQARDDRVAQMLDEGFAGLGDERGRGSWPEPRRGV